VRAAMAGMREAARIEAVLGAVAEGGLSPIEASDVAIIVAHPDDETIGCGGQLVRLRGATIVVVTNGAPRDGHDARMHGFKSVRAYAARRRQELFAALQIAGEGIARIVCLDIPDQEAAFALPQITRRLATLFAKLDIAVAFTHAYEGGHPDHDATALATHAAAAFRRGSRRTDIIEMPFYRLGRTGWVRQRFSGRRGNAEVVASLTCDQQALKRRMMAAHASQAALLASFTVDAERFRAAPRYDFTKLPNGGRLLYEQQNWGLDGARWSSLARSALAELRAEKCPC
jgi:LmbE family N-acetylglucosaminyl deacetylase